MTKNEKIIRTARFDKRVCTYWILSGAMTLLTTIVGIPLLLVLFFLSLVFTKRYLQRVECILTEKTLVVKKGIVAPTEKSIPIEKITDLGMPKSFRVGAAAASPVAVRGIAEAQLFPAISL